MEKTSSFLRETPRNLINYEKTEVLKQWGTIQSEWQPSLGLSGKPASSGVQSNWAM